MPVSARSAMSCRLVLVRPTAAGGRAEDRGAGDERAAAPEPVAERAGGEEERGEGQGVGVDDPLLRRLAGVEVGGDARQGVGEHRHAGDDHHEGEAHHGEDPAPVGVLGRCGGISDGGRVSGHGGSSGGRTTGGVRSLGSGFTRHRRMLPPDTKRRYTPVCKAFRNPASTRRAERRERAHRQLDDARPPAAGRRRAQPRPHRRDRGHVVFAARGADASMDEIARTAGVGIGTLYRHFPTREALVEAVFHDGVEQLQAQADELLASDAPGDALAQWLHAQLVHAATCRGLAAEAMLAMLDANDGEPSACEAMRHSGAALLAGRRRRVRCERASTSTTSSAWCRRSGSRLTTATIPTPPSGCLRSCSTGSGPADPIQRSSCSPNHSFTIWPQRRATTESMNICTPCGAPGSTCSSVGTPGLVEAQRVRRCPRRGSRRHRRRSRAPAGGPTRSVARAAAA